MYPQNEKYMRRWIHGERLSLSVLTLWQRLKFPVIIAAVGNSVLWYIRHLMFPSRELIVLASSTIVEDIDTMKAGLTSFSFFSSDFREV